MSKNKVWFEPNLNKYKYINYWTKNIDSIYQRKRDEVNKYLCFLGKSNIIIYDDAKKKEMRDKYFSTAMQTLNICPGFSIYFTIPSREAIEKDKSDKLEKLISEKIKEGLSIINLEWEKILK